LNYNSKVYELVYYWLDFEILSFLLYWKNVVHRENSLLVVTLYF